MNDSQTLDAFKASNDFINSTVLTLNVNLPQIGKPFTVKPDGVVKNVNAFYHANKWYLITEELRDENNFQGCQLCDFYLAAYEDGSEFIIPVSNNGLIKNTYAKSLIKMMNKAQESWVIRTGVDKERRVHLMKLSAINKEHHWSDSLKTHLLAYSRQYAVVNQEGFDKLFSRVDDEDAVFAD